MSYEFNNTDDIIDVRDMIERLEELETEREALGECHADADLACERELAAILDELKGQGGDEQWRGDWYPVTLIRDSYFNEYMDDMVADCYDIPKGPPSFMSIVLDYRALQMDYTSIEIDGVTYWYR